MGIGDLVDDEEMYLWWQLMNLTGYFGGPDEYGGEAEVPVPNEPDDKSLIQMKAIMANWDEDLGVWDDWVDNG